VDDQWHKLINSGERSSAPEFVGRSLLLELQLPSETEVGEVIINFGFGNGGELHKRLVILLGSLFRIGCKEEISAWVALEDE
jgi:hypothetical protein